MVVSVDEWVAVWQHCRVGEKKKCWLTALLTFRPVLPSGICRSWMYHLNGPLQNVLSRCDWTKYAHLKAMSRAGALPKVIAVLPQSVCNRKRPFLLFRFSHLKNTKNKPLDPPSFYGSGLLWLKLCCSHSLLLASVGYVGISVAYLPVFLQIVRCHFVPNGGQSADHSLTV